MTRPLVVKFKRAVHARKRGPFTALDWIAPLTLGCHAACSERSKGMNSTAIGSVGSCWASNFLHRKLPSGND